MGGESTSTLRMVLQDEGTRGGALPRAVSLIPGAGTPGDGVSAMFSSLAVISLRGVLYTSIPDSKLRLPYLDSHLQTGTKERICHMSCLVYVGILLL